jgi:cytoskeletal protein CcmA (bactofilin family)
MKKLLLVLFCFAATIAAAQSLQDGGAGYDSGALRKSSFAYFGGATQEPSYTVVSGHLIEVNACCVNLWDNALFAGYPKNYNMPATQVTLNNNATNYIVADYNGGAPIIKVITNVELINESSVVPILTIYDSGGYFHSLNWDELGVGLANKLHQRLVKTQRYQRESGISPYLLNAGTDLTFGITEGKVWYGAKRQDLDALDSTTDTILRVMVDGTVVGITALNNINYDSGGVLAVLTSNRYAVNWIYRGIEEQNHCYIMLGQGDYTLTEAQVAQPPAPPAIINSHAQLVGKAIIQKSSNNPYSLESAFDVRFAVSGGVTAHNDLTGLNTGNYQHLTAAELLFLQDIPDNYVATSSLVTTLMGYALLNGSATQDFAIDHLDAVTASITTALQVGTDVDISITGDGDGNAEFDTDTATFTGDVDVLGAMRVGAASDISIVGDGSGNVDVTANTITIDSDVEFLGTVTGLPIDLTHIDAETASFSSNVDIDGHVNGTTASFTGNVDIAGDLTINGDSMLGTINDALTAILGGSPVLKAFGFDATTGTIVGYNIAAGIDVVVPAQIDSVNVTAVSQNAFYYSNIKSIDMTAAAITTLEDRAFFESALQTVLLPSTLTSIGASAFYSNNNLISVVVPPSVTSVGNSAFNQATSMTSIDIGDATTYGTDICKSSTSLATVIVGTTIPSGAFGLCPVTKVTIGAGATIFSDASVGSNGTGFTAAYTSGGAGTYNYSGGTWTKE